MPTNVYDVTFPPDTQLANLLGQDLRNFRLDVQQRMALISGTLAARWNPATDAQPANWTGLLYFATDTSQMFQWSGAAWVDVTSAVLGILSGGTTGGVRVVAVANLATLQANVATTLLYAVPVGGLFRVSGYIVTTQVATTSSTLPSINLIWTDNDSGVVYPPQAMTQTSVANSLGQFGSFSSAGGTSALSVATVISAKTGTNISFQTSGYASSGVTPMQYSLHLRLEFLG